MKNDKKVVKVSLDPFSKKKKKKSQSFAILCCQWGNHSTVILIQNKWSHIAELYTIVLSDLAFMDNFIFILVSSTESIILLISGLDLISAITFLIAKSHDESKESPDRIPSAAVVAEASYVLICISGSWTSPCNILVSQGMIGNK